MNNEYIKGGLHLVAGHLSAFCHTKVSPEEVAAVLRAGTLDLDCLSEGNAALLCTMFAECSPNMILKCIQEADATIEAAQALYSETTRDYHRVPEWEEVVANEKLKNSEPSRF